MTASGNHPPVFSEQSPFESLPVPAHLRVAGVGGDDIDLDQGAD
jgi:hypothetical protein